MFKGRFREKGISLMFERSFKQISRGGSQRFQGIFKEVSRVSNGNFGVFHDFFTGVSKKFHVFKDISRLLCLRQYF